MDLPQVNIRKILYTTDLSESARQAFAYAVSLADAYGASLSILHVMAEDPTLETGIIGYIGEEQWQAIKQQNRREAQEALIGKRRTHMALRDGLTQFAADNTSAMAAKPVTTDEVFVLRGNPVEQIVKTAESEGCDLIVMGTHGLGAIADAVMGSTARRVIRRCQIPVLVVRLPDEE